MIVLQIASDGLKGRVIEASLADLQKVSIHNCTSGGLVMALSLI